MAAMKSQGVKTSKPFDIGLGPRAHGRGVAPNLRIEARAVDDRPAFLAKAAGDFKPDAQPPTVIKAWGAWGQTGMALR